VSESEDGATLTGGWEAGGREDGHSLTPRSWGCILCARLMKL